MNILLLAAGEGTRFRPHTSVLPKPAIPLCGAPLLYYSFYLSRCLQPKKVTINTYHLPDEIHRVGKTLSRFGVDVSFSDEAGLLLGSAGGIAKAAEHFRGEGDFLVLNADEVIIPNKLEVMKDFYHQAQQSSHLSVLMVMRHPEAGKKFGAIWVTASGKVLGFGRVPPESSEELIPYHFIGPMFFRERIFQRLRVEPSNILHDVLKQALLEGETVGIVPVECDWFETGNLEDYLLATSGVLEKIREGNRFLGQMHADLNLDFELILHRGALVLKHKTAVVDVSADIRGWAVIGANVNVGRGAYLEEVVCADNIILPGDAHFKKCLVLQSPVI